jgi:hypothetical protein
MDPKDIANLITEDVRLNNGLAYKRRLVNESVLLNEGLLEAFKQGLKGFMAGLADKPVNELSPEEIQRYSAEMKDNPDIVKLAKFAKYFDEASTRIGQNVLSMLDDESVKAEFEESWGKSVKIGYGALMARLTKVGEQAKVKKAKAEAQPAQAPAAPAAPAAQAPAAPAPPPAPAAAAAVGEGEGI